MVLLGSCRKFAPIPSIENPNWDTELVASALEQQGYKVLLLDMRQTCRRNHGEHNGCSQFYNKESCLLTIATAINLKVALEHYKIKPSSVISIAEVWYRQFPALKRLLPQLENYPHYHINVHLGWFGRPRAHIAMIA